MTEPLPGLDSPLVTWGRGIPPSDRPDVRYGSVLSGALRRGLLVRIGSSGGGAYDFGIGSTLRHFRGLSASSTSLLAARVAASKDLTNTLLRRGGIPVPCSMTVHSLEEAHNVADQFGFPVVLKPVGGNKGRSVYVNIQNHHDLDRIYPLIPASPRDGVQIEEHLTGNDYRLLVVDGRTIAVNQRFPPVVVGDGHQTVRQLIEDLNRDPQRTPSMATPLQPITINDQTVETLRSFGLALDDRLESGRTIPVKSTSNVSTGGSTTDVTDDLHPDNAAVAGLAARIIGLDIAGVDLILPHISRSIWETGGGIIEINSGPGLVDHYNPVEGSPRDIGTPIITMLYPEGAPTRIPVIAVMPSRESQRICQTLAEHLTLSGKRVGLSTSQRLVIDRVELPVSRDPADRIRAVFANPTTDIAVIEIDASRPAGTIDLLRSCSIAVIPVRSDVLSPRGEPIETDLLERTRCSGGSVVIHSGAMTRPSASFDQDLKFIDYDPSTINLNLPPSRWVDRLASFEGVSPDISLPVVAALHLLEDQYIVSSP